MYITLSLAPIMHDSSTDILPLCSPEALKIAALNKRNHCENLADQIITLSGHLNAAEYPLIKLLDEFDQNEGWHGDGIKSFAHWLNWQVGMGNVMAREKVRVARALRELPKIDAAFLKGEVSYSKVRAMTRVATTENEHFLLEIAEFGTAQQVEYLVKKYKLAKRLNSTEYLQEKLVLEKGCFWHQEEDGMTVFEIRLPSEDGAVLIKAIENIADGLKKEHLCELKNELSTLLDAESGSKLKAEQKSDSAEDEISEKGEMKDEFKNVSAGTFLKGQKPDIFSHRADALTLMAEHCLSKGADNLFNRSGADTQHVLLHLNANQLSRDYKINQGPLCYTDDNQHIPPSIANKLSCDASISLVIEDDNNNVVNIGRKTRIIPLAMKRALKMRDQGCVFPGCCQTKWTDSHHIKHWSEGGETSMNNLITLCRYHHTQLHKGEYRIEKARSLIKEGSSTKEESFSKKGSKSKEGALDKERSPDKETGNQNPTLNFINKRNEVIVKNLYPQFTDPNQSTESIEKLSDKAGLNINRNTAASNWQGDQLDVYYAVEILFGLDGEPC